MGRVIEDVFRIAGVGKRRSEAQLFSYQGRITRVIGEFCKEEGVPFQESRSMWTALGKHYSHLYEMGSDDRTRSEKAKKMKGE